MKYCNLPEVGKNYKFGSQTYLEYLTLVFQEFKHIICCVSKIICMNDHYHMIDFPTQTHFYRLPVIFER